MSVDFALVQLALVFFPGIVWATIHRRFGTRTKVSNFDFLLQVFVFGVIAYSVSYGGYWALDERHPLAEVLRDVTAAPDLVLRPRDVIVSAIVASALAIGFLYAENYKLLTRFLQSIRATRTFGDEDVWDFTFNSAGPAFEYAQFRDHAKGLVFSGWVASYSSSGEVRELVLERAQVHDFDGELLYEMPYIYLSRNPEDIQIDFPYGAGAGSRRNANA